MPSRSKSQQRLFGMVHAYQKGKLKNAPEEVKNIARSISDEDAEHFAKTKHKGLPEKKAGSRLYTYLPKDNTALTEGLLSTALTDKGFEKYRGRTGKYTKEDVLKVLDSWEPEWTRSKAISALTEPIPSDAADDFQEFARDKKLYSFSTKDLIKAKILAHLRRARKGGGTDPVDEVKKERLNWHRKKKHLLFQGVPHYFVETTGGRIPPEFVREEKKASAKIDIPALYEEVRRAYADMGYPVSGDRLVLSEQPTYVDGRPVPADVMSPNESGGNTQHDGTVRINPRYRAVMRHWGLKGPGRDFLRTIIGHEVGHHIDRTVLGDRPEERRRLLREIAKAKFHTVYTDSYGPDTDPRKLDKELLAEYLANMVKRKLEKKADDRSERLAKAREEQLGIS